MDSTRIGRNEHQRNITGGRALSLRNAALAAALLALLAAREIVAQPQVSPDGLWTILAETPAQPHPVGSEHSYGRQVLLNVAQLQRQLSGLRRNDDVAAPAPEARISLPTAAGGFLEFRVTETALLAAQLAAKFPELRTFRGVAVSQPAVTAQLDWTAHGFHAQILGLSSPVYIEPLYRSRDAVYYRCYDKRELPLTRRNFTCLVEEESEERAAAHSAADAPGPTAPGVGGALRVYRAAICTTGEYTQFHGGTVIDGLSAVVTVINRVNQILENDLSIQLQLVADNDQLIFTNPATDPFDNNNPATMNVAGHNTMVSIIGLANFDLGHTFNTGPSGLAAVAGVCNSSTKGRASAGLEYPLGDAYFVDLVSHEIGHQFGAHHTWSGALNACSLASGHFFPTAFEPGSGSTIMAYAGICFSDNLQAHADPYYHHASIVEINDFLASGGGGDCVQLSANGNTPPVIDAGADYTIPRGTPFTLTAAAYNDVDGDTLTFCWEQRDPGQQTPITAPDNGMIPLFRSFPPSLSPARTFPDISTVLGGPPLKGEQLPQVGRMLNFRCQVRDNRGGGGATNYDDAAITVDAGSGPFRVLAPNDAGYYSGSVQVLWDVANTIALPVAAANVRILLSVDGGQTWPYTLAATTVNDGAHTVLLPDLETSAARIRIEALGNIFFDVSDDDFHIYPSGPAWFIATGNDQLLDQSPNPSGTLEPGETADLFLEIQNLGGGLATSVTAMLSTAVPTATLNNFFADYPDLGSGAVGFNVQPFQITLDAAHACGTSVPLTLSVASDQGATTMSIRLSTGDPSNSVSSFTYDSILSGNPALPIPDDNSALLFPFTFPGAAGEVRDVNFLIGGTQCTTNFPAATVGIDHDFAADLKISLISPSGREVTLIDEVGGNGHNFCNVLLDDDGGFPLIEYSTPAQHPFTGGWTPMQPLAGFDGDLIQGVWQLRIFDTYPLVDSGNLRSFSVIVEHTACKPVYATGVRQWHLFP